MRLSSSRSTAILHRPQQDFPLWDKAGTRPGLDQQFADRRDLIDAISGQQLITFTRASAGTYRGSDGLIKTATTNLLLQSEDFSTTWSLVNYTVTTGHAAPDGSLNAWKIIKDDVLTIGGISQNVTPVIASTAYMYSIYAKAGELTKVGIREGVGTGAYSTFDLSSGSLISSGNASDGTITPAGDGWYRISFVRNTNSGQTSYGCRVYALPATYTSGPPTVSWINDNTSGIYLWGAQLEQSSTVGEYVPTTSTINSAPRFDHDPVTGESLGLLVEEQRTNLLLRSEEFGTTWTTLQATISADQETSPSGTLTGDKLIETTTTGAHYVTQAVSALTGVYTVSVYIKAAGVSNAMLIMVGGTTQRAVGFNLSTGATYPEAIGGVSPPDIGASAVNVGNGWWRCRMTWTADGQTTLRIQTDSGTGTSVTIGDGTSGIYIWGAQLEAGSFPTSYIPTTSSTVTRAADVASIEGANFSSWYRQDEGTLYAQSSTQVPSNVLSGSIQPAIVSLDDGTPNNRISLFYAAGPTIQARIVSSGSAFNPSQRGCTLSNDKAVIAYKAETGGGGVSVNGILSTASNPSTIPVTTQMRIGSAATPQRAEHIRRLTYWPQRLPNDTLETITQ